MKALFSLIFLSLFIGVINAQEVTPEVSLEANIPINTNVSEVSAYLQTDNFETIIGKPISTTLRVEMPAGYTLLPWQVDALVEPLQVIDIDEVVSTQQGTLQKIKQDFMLVAWDLNTITTGEVFLTYETATGQQYRTPVTSITINVTATRKTEDTSLRPLKPLIELPFIPLWVYILPIGFVIVTIIIIRTVRFNQKVDRALSIADTPFQHAIVDLKHLLDRNLSNIEIYPLVADKLRIYLTEQYQIRAIDMTTIELARHLKNNSNLSDRLYDSLIQILEQADLVKFANYIPVTSPEIIINDAIRWIEHAERTRIAHE